MAKSKTQSASTESEVAAQSNTETQSGIAAQATEGTDTEVKEPTVTVPDASDKTDTPSKDDNKVEEPTTPSKPNLDSVKDENVKWLAYDLYTLGIDYGYANATKKEYTVILNQLGVVDTKTKNAVFKALGK